MQNKYIPVTILTGFLGAGKTTLLNHLVSSNPGTRYAIIENEFGDIAIDSELVVSSTEGIYELANGCICCSLNAELARVLRNLLESTYEFDHLLIETTGVAEPDGVAAAFIGPGKNERYRLDGTICLADALSIIQNLEEVGEAVKQISFADAILLNKTDLVDEATLNEAMGAIRQYNPLAPIHPCTHGRVDTALLHNIKAYDQAAVESEVVLWMRLPALKHELVAHSFAFDEALDAVKFEHWINMLLFLSGYQIYRVKGILHIAGMCDRVIFQSVRSQFRIERGRPWEEGEVRQSRIVFIGYNVKRPALEKGLESCKVSD